MDNYIDDYIRVRVLKPGIKLYHYTSAIAVQNILETNRLWGTKHDFLNDRAEFEYAYKIFVSKILSKIADLDLKTRIEAELEKAIQNDLGNMTESGELSGYYVISLSKNSDNLALWSEFTGGTGYSIGLDYETLKKSFGIRLCWEGEVIYDESLQLKYLEETWRKLLSENCGYSFERILKESDENVSDEIIYNIAADAAVMCIAYGMFYKKPEFAIEEEYRFVFFATHGKEDSKTFVPIKFRTKRDTLIPYIEVNGDILGALDSITVGPKNNIDIARASLEFYCMSKGLDVNINKSKILLRY